MIEQLTVLGDVQYAEALADCVMDPEPTEQAAFRSDALANRSLIAARYLIDHVNSTIRRNEAESNGSWAKRAEHYRNRVGMERRLLETIVAGIRAQRGMLAAPPNPRGRALKELARRYPQEFLAIVREEQEKDRTRIAREKAERKELRKAEKAAECETRAYGLSPRTARSGSGGRPSHPKAAATGPI